MVLLDVRHLNAIIPTIATLASKPANRNGKRRAQFTAR
jgi:hypothetical protein